MVIFHVATVTKYSSKYRYPNYIYIVNHPSIISQDLLEFTIVISFTTFFNSPRRFLHARHPEAGSRKGEKKVENLQQQHVHIKITPSEKKHY